MKQLDTGYSVVVDEINRNTWSQLLKTFDDASFYQTWSYGAKAWGDNNLSHLVLKKDDKVVSITQLRIARLPFMKLGFAYAAYAPMWRIKGEEPNTAHLRNMIKALHNEYVRRRGFLLRILPRVLDNADREIHKNFVKEGYTYAPDSLLSVVIDLSPDIINIRRNLGSGWRDTLKRAEKNKLDILDANDDNACDVALNLIKEMKERKNFTEFGDMSDLVAIHKDLDSDLKLKLMFCQHEGEAVAVLGWSTIGEIGHLLIAATGDKALRLKAAYPLYWEMIEFYKNNGFSGCDLGGVSNERNPGGYYFKTGLAGKNWTEQRYAGQFDACENIISNICFRAALFLREQYRYAVSKTKSILQ
jgi:hypothetical protein